VLLLLYLAGVVVALLVNATSAWVWGTIAVVLAISLGFAWATEYAIPEVERKMTRAPAGRKRARTTKGPAAPRV
jgi:hypothetical protein